MAIRVYECVPKLRCVAHNHLHVEQEVPLALPQRHIVKMVLSRLSLYLYLLHGALGAQPSAPSPIAAPLRELPWGQLNFLQTTDTHGWHGGHLQESVDTEAQSYIQ